MVGSMSTKKTFCKSKMLKALILSLFLASVVVQLIPLLQVSAQTSVENDFIAILNAERIKLGKNPLTINSYLSTAAYLHSQDMAEKGYFSHTSSDGTTFVQRVINAGYTNYYSLGENLAYHYGAADAARVYDMWKNSAGHYANMIGDFNEAGLGVYSAKGYTYYTLDLGKRSNPVPPPPPPPTTKDFTLSASPSAVSVQAGFSGTSTVTVTSLNSFSGTVALTVSAPTGWTVSVNPSSVAVASGASASATISVTVPSSATTGTYTITVTAASGSISHSATVTVNVGASSPLPSSTQGFSISASPSTISVNVPSSKIVNVTVSSLGGFSGSVSFSVSVVPVGWRITFSPSWVTVASGSSASSIVSLSVPSTAVGKTYTIWVIGRSGSLRRYVGITVSAQASEQGQTAPSAPQNVKATGGNSQVSLSWSASIGSGGSAATGYKVYRRIGTSETLLATLANLLSYVDTAVANGQTYYYRVTTVNSVGESAKSNEVSATPSAPKPLTTEGLNVVIIANMPSYLGSTYGTLIATVTGSITGNPLQGASLSIQLYGPSGDSAGSLSLTTDSSGTAQGMFELTPSVPIGTYMVIATASLVGYPPKMQITFVGP